MRDKRRPVPEEGSHEIEVEQTDEAPVQTSDDQQNHGEYVDGFHLRLPH